MTDKFHRKQLILIPTPEYIHDTADKILAYIVNVDEQDKCVGCNLIYRMGIWDSRYINIGFEDIISDDDIVIAFVDDYNIDLDNWNIGLENAEKYLADSE